MGKYTNMPLDEQIPILEQEDKNYRLRAAKGMMWDRALEELTDSEKTLGSETDKLEPTWKDEAGGSFVAHARNSQTVLRRWTHNISSNNPSTTLNQINVLVAQALA